MTIPCCYLAPVSHYSVLLHAKEGVLLEVNDHYRKQTLRNRCMIDSPQGVLSLSIPVEKPAPHTLMRDIRISDHGNWRHLHWNALLSSYSQSPFFEYYADDFAPFYEKKWEFLADFNEDLLRLVCSLIDINTPVSRTISYAGEQPPFPQKETPYYQVFVRKHGFLPNLSIVDLLFNMGPESLLLL
ncbi:MAG: WbqC family protein [Bacteroidaceae bacterium]|nr:WbqC family protein [Bacteroidaceae bacterium]